MTCCNVSVNSAYRGYIHDHPLSPDENDWHINVELTILAKLQNVATKGKLSSEFDRLSNSLRRHFTKVL